MALDIHSVIANIESFYDFNDKTVIHVGAGGGQLLPYAHSAKGVLAVDPDMEAMKVLQQRVMDMGWDDKFSIITGDYCDMDLKGDVVYFEFCMHEMDDPVKALHSALKSAPQVVIIDHAIESDWSWRTFETEKLKRSWGAIEQLKRDKDTNFIATQCFNDYEELSVKLAPLGPKAMQRIGDLKCKAPINISMPYRMVLIGR